MKKKTKQKTVPRYWGSRTLLVVGVILVLSVSLQAQYKPFYTYYNFNFGARALSMGNAFTAVADDLTSVFWNPAGLAEFKYPEAYLSYRKNKMQDYYDIQAREMPGYVEQYTYDFESSLKNIDFLSVSVPAQFWGMKWTFALSFYRMIPYNMEGNSVSVYSADSESYIGETTTMTFTGDSGIDVLAFTAAYYYSDYFSLGLTVQQFLNSGTMNYHYLSSAVEYDQEYTEKIEGRNLILGFVFKPMKDVVLGMTYRTRLRNYFHSEYIRQEVGSTIRQVGTTRSSFEFPARLSFGLMLRPFKFMRMSFDYSILYWTLGKVSDYYGSSEDLPYPVRDAFSFAQEDCHNYRMGVEFNIPYDRFILFLRGGLFTERQLFKDSNDGIVKVSGYSFGIGADVSSVVSVDLAYARQNSNWLETPVFNPADEVFSRYNNDVLSLSVTFRFTGLPVSGKK